CQSEHEPQKENYRESNSRLHLSPSYSGSFVRLPASFPPSSEEARVCVGAVNLHVARSAVLVACLFKIVEVGRIGRRSLMRVRMALYAELSDSGSLQQPRVRGTVCIVAGCAAFNLCRRVLEHKRALLVRMTLHAGLVCARNEAELL